MLEWIKNLLVDTERKAIKEGKMPTPGNYDALIDRENLREKIQSDKLNYYELKTELLLCLDAFQQAVKNCRDTDWKWRNEITKYLPALAIMSHSGPEWTIKWLFEHVELDEQSKQLRKTIYKIDNDPELTEEQKDCRRLEAFFPNLKPKEF